VGNDSDPLLSVADSILYVCSLLGDRRRSIDAYIDYFGGPPASPATYRQRFQSSPVRRAS
jgi:hypothetical protein